MLSPLLSTSDASLKLGEEPVGIHVLFIPQQGLIVLNLTEEHQRLLQLLGARYVWFYR
jgi:hypothetical protein